LLQKEFLSLVSFQMLGGLAILACSGYGEFVWRLNGCALTIGVLTISAGCSLFLLIQRIHLSGTYLWTGIWYH
jgi:hypothetical protein